MEVRLTTASHEKWVKEFLRKRYPKLESQYRAAYNAFRAILKRRKADPGGLALIENCAASPHQVLWDNASQWLRHLSGRFDESHAVVERLARHKLAKARFAAICAITEDLPRDLAVRLLRAGLTDASADVRWKASDRARRAELRELVSAIKKQLAVEKNPKVRRNLAFDLPLLRDGYTLKPEGGGYYELTVSGPSGVSMITVSKSDLDRRGVAAIVRRERKQMEADRIRHVYA